MSSAFTYEPSSPGQLWALPRSPIRFFKALGWPHESPQHIRPRSSCGSHLGQPPDTEAASCSLPFWIPLATGHKSNYVSNWFNNIQQHLTYLYITSKTLSNILFVNIGMDNYGTIDYWPLWQKRQRQFQGTLQKSLWTSCHQFYIQLWRNPMGNDGGSFPFSKGYFPSIIFKNRPNLNLDFNILQLSWNEMGRPCWALLHDSSLLSTQKKTIRLLL